LLDAPELAADAAANPSQAWEQVIQALWRSRRSHPLIADERDHGRWLSCDHGVESQHAAAEPLLQVLREIAATPDCHVLAACGPVQVPDNLVIPEDLRRLYELCGGLLLFDSRLFPRRVCGPGDFVPASPRLLGQKVAEQVAHDDTEDLTNTCYVLVDGGHGGSTEPQVVIDLSPERAGRCYAASWDTYGLVGEMPVVASSVVELLRILLRDGGREAQPTSTYDTDAYDA
jgi:hypothetical protein